MTKRALTLAVAIVLTGCAPAGITPHTSPTYRGDGTLTVNSPRSQMAEYSLDLGLVSMSSPGSYRYKIAGLPKAEYHIAVWVVLDNESAEKIARMKFPVSARYTLRDSTGSIVQQRDGPLEPYLGWRYHTMFQFIVTKPEGRFTFPGNPDEKYLLDFEMVQAGMVKPGRLMVLGATERKVDGRWW